MDRTWAEWSLRMSQALWLASDPLRCRRRTDEKWKYLSSTFAPIRAFERANKLANYVAHSLKVSELANEPPPHIPPSSNHCNLRWITETAEIGSLPGCRRSSMSPSIERSWLGLSSKPDRLAAMPPVAAMKCHCLVTGSQPALGWSSKKVAQISFCARESLS
jgi:hypothetical protein